jgi:flagellar motor switch protein FliN/FliY
MPDDHQGSNSDEPVGDQDAPAMDEQAQRLVRQAEPFLDLAPKATPESDVSSEDSSPVARPFQFEEFSRGAKRLPFASAIAGDSTIRLDVELGRTQLEPAELTKLTAGSLVSLNALANEPVDILMQGRLVARAEVVTVDETPGLRIVELL